MDVININKLTKNYGKARGINEVNLTVKQGEIFGFIGPNGAGKSTTIRTLLNFIYPSSGSASIYGMDIVSDSKKIKIRTGYVPSEFAFYSELKVSTMIKYAESFYTDIDKDYVEMLCNRFEVDLNKKFGDLSYGNKKKAAVVQALIHQPDVLIFDEPTNGLDPLMQQRLHETLLQLKKKGVCIFLSSHNLNEVQDWCDRVAIIKEGMIVEVMDIDKTKLKNIHAIRLFADQLSVEDIKRLGGENIEQIKEVFTFEYAQDVNSLIKALAKYEIKEILIQPKRLADTFMSYYNKEDKV